MALRSRWLGNVELFPDSLPAFLNDLLHTGTLIWFQDWIHSILLTRQDPLCLSNVEPTQISELVGHLSQDWSDLLGLLGLETQIALQSIDRRNAGSPWLFRPMNGILYRAARE